MRKSPARLAQKRPECCAKTSADLRKKGEPPAQGSDAPRPDSDKGRYKPAARHTSKKYGISTSFYRFFACFPTFFTTFALIFN